MKGISKPPVATEAPLVSVVVPCRNEIHHIEDTLRLILAQEKPPGGFEVIVAEGMSDDGTREILLGLAQEHPCLRIVENTRGIVSTGLNAGIEVARGHIIMRMDAHTRYGSDYIKNCVSVLRSTGADNVGGAWVAKGEGIVSRAIAAAFASPFSFGGNRGHNSRYEGPVDTVYLGCWPRDIFERIGYFDEELIRNQDDEFNLRITRAGGRIWQSPKIKSWYTPRNSLAMLFKQYMQYGYWKVRVIQKHRIPASWRHLVPAAFLLSVVFLAVVALWLTVARLALITVVSLYVLSTMVASLSPAARNEPRIVLLLPLVFPCYHFGYGYGFLRGILDFIVFRRQPTKAYTALSRASAPTDI